MTGPVRPRGAWGWLLQRVSAVLLLVLVLAHLWIEHFLHLGARITYHGVSLRLAHALYDLVDYALLVVVVYHALNGLRNVLMERVHSPRGIGWLTTALVIWGLATIVLGADILSAFLNGRAWFYL